MSVLDKYFNKDINQCSPVQKDYDRVVNYDEDGREYITYKEVDYPTLQASHGTVDLWSLNALLSAGVNPNFSIHTGNNTRLEGLGVIKDAEAIADSILAEVEKEKSVEE